MYIPFVHVLCMWLVGDLRLILFYTIVWFGPFVDLMPKIIHTYIATYMPDLAN